jgi:membrane protein implicated in regulation of membrane protease activity
LELAPTGRLLAWLGLSLLIVGFMLSDPLIILSATVLLLYLLFEAIVFRRVIERAKESIKVESHPSRIETTVGRQLRIENSISNQFHSRFHVSGFNVRVPPQIDNDTPLSSKITLGPNGVHQTETFLRTKVPGHFELTTSTVLLDGRGGLFRHTLHVQDKVVILAKPRVTQLDRIQVVSEDLTVDRLRRGTGTDLAGIRPFNYWDDFREIDWKATARTGKTMKREAYLEKDPTVILMVDISLGTSRNAILPELMSGIGDLLATIQPTSPLGLILYDHEKIIEFIEPGTSQLNRESILRAILETVKLALVPTTIERHVNRSRADLTREAKTLKESTIDARRTLYSGSFRSFANFVGPFYHRAESKYLEHIRKQGLFKAFEAVCALPEPALIIVIRDDPTNSDGLAEGTKSASLVGHNIVVAIPTRSDSPPRIDTMSDLKDQRVRICRCHPEDLPRAISAEILMLGHTRNIPSEGGY